MKSYCYIKFYEKFLVNLWYIIIYFVRTSVVFVGNAIVKF